MSCIVWYASHPAKPIVDLWSNPRRNKSGIGSTAIITCLILLDMSWSKWNYTLVCDYLTFVRRSSIVFSSRPSEADRVPQIIVLNSSANRSCAPVPLILLLSDGPREKLFQCPGSFQEGDVLIGRSWMVGVQTGNSGWEISIIWP